MDRAPTPAFDSLSDAALWFEGWLRRDALPLWSDAGWDPVTAGFREGLWLDGARYDPRRRARVQARQIHVFASAAVDLSAPVLAQSAQLGWVGFVRSHQRSDGLFASETDPAGAVTDATPRLYEHAFVLLALAALARLETDGQWSKMAESVLEALASFRHPPCGFRETGPEQFQANAQMHVLEAALAWEAIAPIALWRRLADQMAELAMARFIDAPTGALREFFDAEWQARVGEAGLIEPGHQFEWAWLLERWGQTRGDDRACAAARRLFAVGRRGFDPIRNVVVNALWDDLTVRDSGARLWAQTEHIRAALQLSETENALTAASGLAAFLATSTPGVWHERMRPDGGFIDEPAPATSLYHLYGAIQALRRASRGG